MRFAHRGKEGLTVRNAATGLVEVQAPMSPRIRISEEARARLQDAFGEVTPNFDWIWLGGATRQNEVVNWEKAREKVRLKWYPGEFKIPGGIEDVNDRNTEATAWRELNEELMQPCGLELPSHARLRLFHRADAANQIQVKYNVQLRGFESENSWLKEINVEDSSFTQRRQEFKIQWRRVVLADGQGGKTIDMP